MKLVSVIIPYYKKIKFIEDCVVSVLKQTYRKIEILITDKGLEVLDQLDAKIQETEAAILQPLSLEEQKTLRSLINKITLNR